MFGQKRARARLFAVCVYRHASPRRSQQNINIRDQLVNEWFLTTLDGIDSYKKIQVSVQFVGDRALDGSWCSETKQISV